MRIELAPFHALIKDRCGLLIEGNREETLTRALSARIRALGISPVLYYARLLGSADEFQELVNLLTINETYFFREPEQIRLVVDTLVPRLLAARAGAASVRILSAGCSSGEEPYSLVMALMDRYGGGVPSLFSFVAADIDSFVLTKAQVACYTEFSFRNIPDSLRNRYFDKAPLGHRLKEQVKQQVSFHQVNFLASTFPPALHGCDIIFFRNVSIYFDQATRKRIQQNLASLLGEDGALFLGTAETLANDLGVLPLVEEGGLFYFAKSGSARPGTTIPGPSVTRPIPGPQSLVSPPSGPLPSSSAATSGSGDSPAAVAKPSLREEPAIPVTPCPDLDVAAVRRLVAEERYDEALVRLEAALSVGLGAIEAGILKAHVLLHLKDFSGAEAQAHRVLTADAWSVDAFILLGLAAKWQQRPEEAIRWFKQAVYTCPGCWPAHYYLADLYRNNQAGELAHRSYRVVLQLLADEAGNHGVTYMPLDLPVGEIRFLCLHQIAKQSMDAGTAGSR